MSRETENAEKNIKELSIDIHFTARAYDLDLYVL